MFIKVCFTGADSSDSQELAVRDAVFASLWMCRIVVQVIVGVSGFGVEICQDCSPFQSNQSIEEGDFLCGLFCGELDVFRAAVHVGDEPIKFLLSMLPDHENVINVSEV